MKPLATSLSFRSRGVATLVVIIILLFSISGITLFAANTGILEQKVSTNDYRAKQLQSAADAGLQYAMSWIAANNQPNWSTDPSSSAYDIDTTSVSTTLSNGFTASIKFRRATATKEHVTVTSTATETGGASVTAVSQTTILQKKLMMGGGPDAPLVVNGCMSGTVGHPSIENLSGGSDIVSSQPNPATCLPQEHWNSQPSDPTEYATEGNGFTGSAWDLTFGISQAEMQALAGVPGSNVYWEASGSNWNTNIGSAGSPAILVLAGCGKINGLVVIYGLVYVPSTCVSYNGWGSASVYGSVIVDGNLTAMNSNTDLHYDPSYVNALAGDTMGLRGIIPGTWIDE